MYDLDIYNRSVTIYDRDRRVLDVAQVRHLDLASAEAVEEAPGLLRITYTAEIVVEYVTQYSRGWEIERYPEEGYIDAELFCELRDELAIRAALRQRYGTDRPPSIADYWKGTQHG